PVAQGHDVVLNRLELVSGDVHQHVAITIDLFFQQVADAALIEAKLLQPLEGRYVHLRDRRPVDAARLPQAIPPLELPQAMLHPGVEGIAEILTSVRWPEIVLDNQATADIRHPLVVFARTHHRALRYVMPPTLRHDVLVARDRII